MLWRCWLEAPPACKKIWRGWWRWALVSPDGVAPSRVVGVSASVNLPLHHKVQCSLLALAHPDGPGKRAVKWLWWLLLVVTVRVSHRVTKCVVVTAVCVYLSLTALLHGPGCNLGEWYGVPSSSLLGGFAIGARVSLLWQHSTEREMSAISASTRSCASFLNSVV